MSLLWSFTVCLALLPSLVRASGPRKTIFDGIEPRLRYYRDISSTDPQRLDANLMLGVSIMAGKTFVVRLRVFFVFNFHHYRSSSYCPYTRPEQPKKIIIATFPHRTHQFVYLLYSVFPSRSRSTSYWSFPPTRPISKFLSTASRRDTPLSSNVWQEGECHDDAKRTGPIRHFIFGSSLVRTPLPNHMLHITSCTQFEYKLYFLFLFYFFITSKAVY